LSTLVGDSNQKLLKSKEDLLNYFHPFAKSQETVLVGLEAEFFGVNALTGRALPYFGNRGIEEVLRQMAKLFGYETIEEEGHIIALRKDRQIISLEPGGQVELSAPPALNVFEVEQQIKTFVGQLKEVRDKIGGIEFISFGIQPFSDLDNIEWVPKTRYKIMSEYLQTHGTLSHDMMKRTATNQVNFDYLNEEDAMASLRVALALSSFASALFANSSFSKGCPNGYQTKRLDIWNHTDPNRTGLLFELMEEGRTFNDYLEYVLQCRCFLLFGRGNGFPWAIVHLKHFLTKVFRGLKRRWEILSFT